MGKYGNILFGIFMAMIPVCAVEGSIANIKTFHGFYYLTKEVTYRFVFFIITILAYLAVRRWLRRGAALIFKG